MGETIQYSDSENKIQLETLASVCERTSMSKSWIYYRIQDDPTFPKPIKIGNSTRFVSCEVTEWIQSQIEKNRDTVIH